MIKQFEFPTFDEWVNNGYDAYCSVGDYNCAIKAFSHSPDGTLYKCVISTHPVPLNMFASQVFHAAFEYSKGTPEADIDLRDWYNNVCKAANDRWNEFIMQTYLQESESIL